MLPNLINVLGPTTQLRKIASRVATFTRTREAGNAAIRRDLPSTHAREGNATLGYFRLR